MVPTEDGGVHDIIAPHSPGPEVQGGGGARAIGGPLSGQTGKHLLVLRLTGFDPHPTSRPGQKTPALPEREDRMLAAWYRSLDTLAREGHMTVIIGRRE